MKTEKKTNAARLLDKAGVIYETVPYEVDENDLAATHVAEQLHEDIAQVFKTLGDTEVDLKKAARVSGNKHVSMLPMKELLPATGYIRGGCSPIGMKKPLPTYIHESCTQHPHIYVSAGRRGLQLKLSPNDLATFVGATLADLVEDR